VGLDELDPAGLEKLGPRFKTGKKLKSEQEAGAVYEYYYAWRNNEKRKTLYGWACRVLVRGGMNSCLIEFKNGQREVVSRNAVKRLKRTPDNGLSTPK